MDFILRITREHNFNLFLEGFSAAAYWVTTLIIKAITATVDTHLLRRFISSISIKSLTATVSTRLLRQFFHSIDIKSLTFSGIARRLYRQIHNIYISQVTFVSNIKRMFPVSKSTELVVKQITFAGAPLTGTFYTLGDWDGDTLGTLDVLTLGDMDVA